MSLSPSMAAQTCSRGEPTTFCGLCMNPGPMGLVLDSGEAKLVKCRHCGVTMLNPAPTQAELARYFRDDYINDDQRIEETFERTRQVILSQVAENVLRRRNFGNILDIGCAGGYFLNRFFSRPGWVRHGLEPSRYAGQKAAETGIHVYQGDVLAVDLPVGFFDVVTAMDVLYYFREPQLELRAIRKAMRPDGLLFVELPLAETQLLRNTKPTSMLVGGAGRLLTQCGHLYFFNRSSIEFLLKTNDFHIEAFLPVPANRQGHFYKDLIFRGYYLGSKLAWCLSAHKLMLGPNFLVVASLK